MNQDTFLVLRCVHLGLGCLQNFTRFSAWFGQNSHSAKQRRLLAELSCNMAAAECGASCSRNSVRLDYLPALRQASGVVLLYTVLQVLLHRVVANCFLSALQQLSSFMT
jgi:hypothetical protein